VLALAQTKSGHIDFEELISLMPERDSAQVKLQKFYTEELVATYDGIVAEYQAKLAEYEQRKATWSSLVLETKERELFQIQQRMQEFSENAQGEMAQMNNILLTPVYNKAREAIQKVAKELGLTYVYDSTGLLYIDESQSIHLLDRVKVELKIPADKVAPSVIGGQR